MTPDPDDDLRELLARRAAEVTPRGTFANVERRLAEAPAAPRWRGPVLAGAAAVLALLVGAAAVAVSTGGSDREQVDTAGAPASFQTTSTGPPETLVVPGSTATSTPSTSAPASTTTTSSTTSPTTTSEVLPPTQQPLTDASRVGIRGIGPVQLPTDQAGFGAATGQSATIAGTEPGATCTTLTPVAGVGDETGTPAGVTFLLDRSRLVRVDVRGRSKVRTISGAGIGTAKAELLALYPDAEVLVDKYSSPDAPIDDVVVTAASEPGYQLRFEVGPDGVTTYRAGLTEAVELVEGCG